jgi:uncharacterized damage-inducible protein DinB
VLASAAVIQSAVTSSHVGGTASEFTSGRRNQIQHGSEFARLANNRKHDRIVPQYVGLVTIDDHGRPEPEPAADEATTLLGFLDYQRATLEWKCRGLDAAGLTARVGVSTMTLGGILKHMAWVEDHWFSKYLRDRPVEQWESIDWDADRDWEWNSAAADAPDELRAMWSDATDRSRAAVNDVMASGGLDQLARRTWPSGEAPSLRWIVVHMIEEYARHNGHADLLRESVDGETGE